MCVGVGVYVCVLVCVCVFLSGELKIEKDTKRRRFNSGGVI